MTRRTLTAEELESLEKRARAVGELKLEVLGPLLLELVLGYREHSVDFGDIKDEGANAFLGGMLGSFAGTMLERRLKELKLKPPPQCDAWRGGRRCTLSVGHPHSKHVWGPRPAAQLRKKPPK